MTKICACGCGHALEFSMEPSSHVTRCTSCRWTPTAKCRRVHRDKRTIRTPKHLAPVNDDYSPQIIEALLQRAKRLRKWGVTDAWRTA